MSTVRNAIVAGGLVLATGLAAASAETGLVSRLAGNERVPYTSLTPQTSTYTQNVGQSPSRNYSRSDVIGLLQKKSPHSVFIADVGEIILASYASHDDILSIFVVNSSYAGPRRELSANDPILKYFMSLKAADIFIQDCGEPYGNDEHCDTYSTLNAPSVWGSKINQAPGAIRHHQDLFNRIGEVLSAQQK